MKHNRHPSNHSSKKQATDGEQWMYWQTPNCLTDVLMPSQTPTYGCISHITCRYPEHIQMYRGTYKCVGVSDIWGCPNVWGVYECMDPSFPYHMQIPLKTYRCTGEHGDILGGIWTYGCPNVQRAYEHMGVYKHMGVYRHPLSVEHASFFVGTSYLKLNSYT